MNIELFIWESLNHWICKREDTMWRLKRMHTWVTSEHIWVTACEGGSVHLDMYGLSEWAVCSEQRKQESQREFVSNFMQTGCVQNSHNKIYFRQVHLVKIINLLHEAITICIWWCSSAWGPTRLSVLHKPLWKAWGREGSSEFVLGTFSPTRLGKSNFLPSMSHREWWHREPSSSTTNPPYIHTGKI